MKTRGFTLVELMVAMAVTVIAVAAIAALMIAAVNLSSRSELTADSSSRSRVASDSVAYAMRGAGFGATQGLYIVNGSGQVVRVQPVFGVDGTTGQGMASATPVSGEYDDLWMVVPANNTLGEPGVDTGAAARVLTPGSTLSVRSTATLTGSSILMASNLTTGALLSGITLTPASGPNPGSIAFAESATAGFSDAPQSGGFKPMDLVFPVKLQHFYVANNNAGTPTLYRADGMIADDTYGRPFKDTGTPIVVAQDIEDFQIAFATDPNGTDNPDSYTWVSGLSPTYVPGLKAVRFTVISRSPRAARDGQGNILLEKPMNAENHVYSNPPADGFRRSMFTRRIELVNLSPGVL